MNNITTFKKNYKYSKTIDDRLVSMIDSLWSINDTPIFITWSIGDKLLSFIEVDKFFYICKFLKCCYIINHFESNR